MDTFALREQFKDPSADRFITERNGPLQQRLPDRHREDAIMGKPIENKGSVGFLARQRQIGEQANIVALSCSLERRDQELFLEICATEEDDACAWCRLLLGKARIPPQRQSVSCKMLEGGHNLPGKSIRLILANSNHPNAEHLPGRRQQRQRSCLAKSCPFTAAPVASRHVQENDAAMTWVGQHVYSLSAKARRRSGRAALQTRDDENRSFDASLPVHGFERQV